LKFVVDRVIRLGDRIATFLLTIKSDAARGVPAGGGPCGLPRLLDTKNDFAFHSGTHPGGGPFPILPRHPFLSTPTGIFDALSLSDCLSVRTTISGLAGSS